MNSYAYLIAPTLGWLVAQSLKFAFSLRKNGLQWVDFTASGGMPSSHSAIMMSIATLIGLEQGLTSAMFGLAMAITGIIVYDAIGVRRTVGEHTEAIRELQKADKVQTKVIVDSA